MNEVAFHLEHAHGSDAGASGGGSGVGSGVGSGGGSGVGSGGRSGDASGSDASGSDASDALRTARLLVTSCDTLERAKVHVDGDVSVGLKGVVHMVVFSDPHCVSDPVIVAAAQFAPLVVQVFEEVKAAVAVKLATVKHPWVVATVMGYAAGVLSYVVQSVVTAAVVSERHALRGHLITAAVTVPIAEEQEYQADHIHGAFVGGHGAPVEAADIARMEWCMSGIKECFRCGTPVGVELDRKSREVSDGAQIVVSVVLRRVMRRAPSISLGAGSMALTARCVCLFTVSYDPATTDSRYYSCSPLTDVVNRLSW